MSSLVCTLRIPALQVASSIARNTHCSRLFWNLIGSYIWHKIRDFDSLGLEAACHLVLYSAYLVSSSFVGQLISSSCICPWDVIYDLYSLSHWYLEHRTSSSASSLPKVSINTTILETLNIVANLFVVLCPKITKIRDNIHRIPTKISTITLLNM